MGDAKKGTAASELVTASTTIEATPEAVVAVLAEPSTHADIEHRATCPRVRGEH